MFVVVVAWYVLYESICMSRHAVYDVSESR